MIAFRDFSPRQTDQSAGIDRALVEVNQWLARTGIKPLNIETLRNVTGTMAISSSDVGLRVWYMVVGTADAEG
ncbi:hypothetical protein GCM10027277_33260 [Pseudoduganella ginsengisoli]|uniref:Uncharacterized protein n=1 Tax=Pseudoduganella ginsengisoli TaxID=1462440 RepID=A0A6L6Q7R0_9BURK|nr:hypothetical protein [Pseudoduganella ginsengisoli]MTW05311.1 hypothetical protein [Pseudoduganella ginsengisoli]